jgi:hypothetical protein
VTIEGRFLEYEWARPLMTVLAGLLTFGCAFCRQSGMRAAFGDCCKELSRSSATSLD